MQYFKENTCQSCEHFIQHYACLDGKFTVINAGHCIQSRRSKHIQAISPSCEHWTAQSDVYRMRHEPQKERVSIFMVTVEQ